MRLSLFIGLGVCATLVGAEALADDKAACFDAASRGQTLRDEHELIEARDQFVACAQQQCPASMQTDCAEWLEAVDRSIATVVFAVTDTTGASVLDVRVRVDGQPLVAALDGRAVPVNPGLHVFHFERPDGTSVQQAVLVNEGDKNQKVAVVLPRSPPPSLPSPPPPAPGLGARTILGLSAGVAGVAGLIVGGVFAIRTAAEASQQKSDCSPLDCTVAGHAQALTDHSTAVTDGTVSTVAFLGGGLLVVSGAVLFLTTGHASARPVGSAPVVWSSLGPGGGLLSVRGGF